MSIFGGVWALICALGLLLCFAAQTTVFSYWSAGGIAPNLLLLFVASVGFVRGRKQGMIAGFFAGLLLDLLYGGLLGFYALLMVFLGYGNGVFRRLFFPDDIKMPMALFFLSDLTYSLTVYILLFLLKGRFNFAFYLRSIILPQALYTLLLAPAVYLAVGAAARRMDAWERKWEEKGV